MTKQITTRPGHHELEVQRNTELLDELEVKLEQLSQKTQSLVQITYDPTSQADAGDLLGLSASRGFPGVVLGGRIGLAYGAACDDPRSGTLLGLGFGLIADLLLDQRNVQQGWRVRARARKRSLYN